MSFQFRPSSEWITAGSHESVLGGAGGIESTVNSDLLPRPPFSQGLSSGLRAAYESSRKRQQAALRAKGLESEWEEGRLKHMLEGRGIKLVSA